MSQVQFFTLTSTQYQSLSSKDSGTLYFLTDTQQIFRGDVSYSHPVIVGTSFPETGLVGTLYINSETQEVKIWNGTAWIVVQMAVSTSLTDSDEVIPTSKAVKTYVDDAIDDVVSGGGAVTDVAYADKTITVVKGSDSSTALKLSGLVDGATFDGTTGVLSLTTNGGTPIEINLPVEQFLSAAAYNADTHILTLTMTDSSSFEVNLADLIDTYTGTENSGIAVTISNGEITATLKISAETDNLVELKSDGIYVPKLAWQTIE